VNGIQKNISLAMHYITKIIGKIEIVIEVAKEQKI